MLLVSLGPMLLIGIAGFTAQQEEMSEGAEQALQDQSGRLSDEVGRYLQERMQDVEYLSQNPILRMGSTGAEASGTELETFLETHDMYEDVYLAYTSGIILTDVHSGFRGENLRDRPWFSDITSGEAVISRMYYSDLREEPVMVMAAPLYDAGGQWTRIIIPAFDIESFHREMTGFLERESGAWETDSVLMNESGEVIIHEDMDQVLRDNYLEQRNIEQAVEDDALVRANGDVHAFTSVDSFPGFDHNWYISVSAAEEEMFAPLDALLRDYLLIALLVLLGVIPAVFWLSSRLTVPVHQLMEKAAALAAGREPVPAFKGTYAEITQLNETFDSMANEIKDREELHRRSTLVLESTDNGVFSFEAASGSITLWNRRCRSMFGLDKPDTIADIAAASPAFRTLLPSLSFSAGSTEREMKLEEDGSVRTFTVSTTPLDGAEKEEWLVLFFDMTDKRNMEQEMVRSEKLKVIAQMAAGFAHEVRNPLTTIRGFIQLAHEKQEPIGEAYYSLVMEEIDRVNKIIHELLQTADPDPDTEVTVIDVNRVLHDVMALQEMQLRSRSISWVQDLDPQVPQVFADEGKLKQALINLIQNAVEAMPAGGELTIRTFPKEEAAAVEIEDTGIGMDEDTMDKLGTPFFTKKETGTGLGLTVSYGLVEEMQGRMVVASRPEEGTCFQMMLPAYDPAG